MLYRDKNLIFVVLQLNALPVAKAIHELQLSAFEVSFIFLLEIFYKLEIFLLLLVFWKIFI